MYKKTLKTTIAKLVRLCSIVSTFKFQDNSSEVTLSSLVILINRNLKTSIFALLETTSKVIGDLLVGKEKDTAK